MAKEIIYYFTNSNIPLKNEITKQIIKTLLQKTQSILNNVELEKSF